MRGIECLYYPNSKLDVNKGITFRGYDIPTLEDLLPKANLGFEPLTEGILYLLLTGEIPNHNDIKEVN